MDSITAARSVPVSFLRKSGIFCALCASLFLSGCFTGNLRLFSDGTEPLKEFVLSGSDSSKILLIPVSGTITMADEGNLLRSRPGMVQEIVSQLRLAEQDSRIKGVVLMVNSPGGTVTASDMVYEELRRFKKRTGKTLTVCMLDLAASGGYYISLPADRIYAHPTTVTGSVGVIFMRVEVDGLLSKIGVSVNADTSGKFKDMGSPFRAPTSEENALFAKLIRDLAARFHAKVLLHRRLTKEQMTDVATAKVYTASDALNAGLIDEIGYVEDVIAGTAKLAGCSENPRVIVFRREKYSNDNTYILETSSSAPRPLMKGVLGAAASLNTGFYFIWPAVIP